MGMPIIQRSPERMTTPVVILTTIMGGRSKCSVEAQTGPWPPKITLNDYRRTAALMLLGVRGASWFASSGRIQRMARGTVAPGIGAISHGGSSVRGSARHFPLDGGRSPPGRRPRYLS
jgi:hypothetical protein